MLATRKDRADSEPRTVFTSKQEIDLPLMAENDEDLQGHIEIQLDGPAAERHERA